MTRNVLVGIDGAEQSLRALEFALNQFPDADVTALHVVDPVDVAYTREASEDPLFEKRWDEVDDVLANAAAFATERDRAIETASETGDTAETIVEYATEEGFDQIVLGSRGRTGLSRVLLGSVAETVARRAPVPVTVVR